MSRPLQIGVTGGIGSGKSMVCRLFSCLDIPVYNADSRARWLTTHDPEIRQNIVTLLGPGAYREDGSYNTSFVSSLVFQDENLLKKLNAIVHPVVMADTEKWVKMHINAPYLVKEAAIMNKAGEGNALDFVVVVEAPVALRISRILERDQRTREQIESIIDRQASDENRRQIANYTVLNDDLTPIIPQVFRLHELFSRY